MTYNIYRPKKELEIQLSLMNALGNPSHRFGVFNCNATKVAADVGCGYSGVDGPDLTGVSELLDEVTAYIRELRSGPREGGRFFVGRDGVWSYVNGEDLTQVIRFVTNKKEATRKRKARLPRNAFMSVMLGPSCPRCGSGAFDGNSCSQCRYARGGYFA